MIRSRKDESSTTLAATVSSPANKNDTGAASSNPANRYVRSSSSTVTPPPPKRHTSVAAGANSSGNNDGISVNTATCSTGSTSNNAATPTSISSFATLSATSVQYYNNLIAQQGYRQRAVKKKSSKRKLNDAIWTVQMPQRMLWSTLGIFLIFPMLIFVWKEFHIKSVDQNELLRGKENTPTTPNGLKKSKNKDFVTWMANHLPPEDFDVDGISNETATNLNSDWTNHYNETTQGNIDQSEQNEGDAMLLSEADNISDGTSTEKLDQQMNEGEEGDVGEDMEGHET
jgi:hypothetical protein